jgi:hypothetical protein
MLKLPFPSICVRIPKSAGLYYDEMVIIEDAAEVVQPNARDDVRRQLADGSEVAALSPDGVLCRSWTLFGTSYVVNAEGIVDQRMSSPGGIFLYEGKDLADVYAGLRGGDDPFSVTTKFLVNFILYLSWPDTGEEFKERGSKELAEAREKLKMLQGYKRERLKDRMKQMLDDRRIYVGAKVPFMESAESTDAGGKLFVRSLVAGHWKMQPCGEGRKDRKLIRIEPYWRGPLDAPVVNAIRKVV